MSYAVVPTAVIVASSFARAGIKSYLESSRFDIVGTGQAFAQRDAEKVALVIAMAEDLGRVEQAAAYLASHADTKLVLLCQPESAKNIPPTVVRMASGILDCETDGKTLLKALDLVMDGVSVHSTSVMVMLMGHGASSGRLIDFEHKKIAAYPGLEPTTIHNQSSVKPLSASELKILKCLADGSSNKVIALRHCLAEATVKIHVKNILRKLNAQNRTQAAIWARENGVHFA